MKEKSILILKLEIFMFVFVVPAIMLSHGLAIQQFSFVINPVSFYSLTHIKLRRIFAESRPHKYILSAGITTAKMSTISVQYKINISEYLEQRCFMLDHFLPS